MRVKKRKKGRLLYLCVVVTILGIVAFLVGESFGGTYYLLTTQAVKNSDGLFSQNAIMVERDTGQVVYNKNADETIYPASMTKIMTAIVAIETIKQLEQQVTVEESVFVELSGSNAAVAGFEVGERVQAIDLIYGTILSSGAECAMALAQYVAGGESTFVALMNQKAEALGMAGTNFVNVTGLHDPRHVSTVGDIYLLLSYALENDVFYSVFTTHSYTTAPTNIHGDGLYLQSTLFSKLDENRLVGAQILGGKTGFTYQAGQCLASLAQVGETQYILVTGGAPVQGSGAEEIRHIEDAVVLYSTVNTVS